MDSAKLTSDKVELSTIIRDESDGGRVRSLDLRCLQLVSVPRTEPTSLLWCTYRYFQAVSAAGNAQSCKRLQPHACAARVQHASIVGMGSGLDTGTSRNILLARR